MLDLRQIEEKWQKLWEAEKIFEADPDPKRQKFFETVPYPYMSGPLHIGHGRTYTLGDVYARFKRMQGFNVLWPMAFHITGTPVLGVASRIAEGEEEARDLYRRYIKNYITDDIQADKILESFADPWNVANFFARVCKQDFRSLGFGID
ncbi:MAG: class I tRNA ligase family protein, partial [Candidatus Ranarchaeia archaeon]